MKCSDLSFLRLCKAGSIVGFGFLASGKIKEEFSFWQSQGIKYFLLRVRESKKSAAVFLLYSSTVMPHTNTRSESLYEPPRIITYGGDT